MPLPPGIRVRTATEHDAEALHALYHAAYAEHNDPHRPAWAGLKDTVEDIRSYLRTTTILVAQNEKGELLATVCLRPLVNVRRLAVAPAHKGDGLGAAMLEEGLAHAAEQGFDLAMLTTLAEHPWLSEFYRRHGFEDYSHEKTPNGLEWRQMRRKLK
ncbi:MAG: GNAT family N-acetyltransferase [Candidatus Thermoplasmatota archaeon]